MADITVGLVMPATNTTLEPELRAWFPCPIRKIAVLGAMTSARTPLMPEVANWFGIVAPAKIPESVVAKLSSALDAALASAELQSTFRARGVELITHSPTGFVRFISDELARWSGTVANAKIDLN